MTQLPNPHPSVNFKISPTSQATVLAQHRALTEAEVRRLAEMARARPETGERNRLLILTLFYTGARISEALDLTPSRLIPPDKVRLPRLKRHGPHLPPDITRVIPMWLWLELSTLAQSGRQDRKLFNISRQMAWRIIKGLGRQVGMDIWPHLARHSRALDLARKTGHHGVVQTLLGHASPRTTELYFRYLDEEQAGDIVRNLAE